MSGILWAFGDSFTAGNAKDTSLGSFFPLGNTLGKNRAYPIHIARKLAKRCVNLAEGGHGNNDIVNTLIKAKPNMDYRKDFVIVGLTTPFRNRVECTPIQALRHLIEDLNLIEKFLHNFNYIVTSAFCPLVPYYFASEDLEFSVKNYVEWGKPNNTLIDICGETWLDSDKINPVMQNNKNKFLSPGFDINTLNRVYLEDCGHPTSAGHIRIAETLMPYIREVVDLKEISYI